MQAVLLLPANSQIVGSESFSVNIPKAVIINGIGTSVMPQTHGVPTGDSTNFSMLVEGSDDGKTWQLTTNIPVGISISYNYGGSIMAVFAQMYRVSDGYTIPPSDISIYPSKVLFDTGAKGGDARRIFHFNPIIRVSKDTPPGVYNGKITFTIVGQ